MKRLKIFWNNGDVETLYESKEGMDRTIKLISDGRQLVRLETF